VGTARRVFKPNLTQPPNIPLPLVAPSSLPPPAVMSKIISADELRANNTREKLYVCIHGKVYNVTKFLDEHPGGDEVILAEAGRDATEAFEDVGHSDEARALLPDMYVGDIDPKSGAIKSNSSSSHDKSKVSNAVEQGSNMMYFVPLGLLGAYFGWRYYTGSA